MLDIHHHCLPGVDDGPRTMEDAVAQCRMAFDEGIRTVIATPHRFHPQFDVPPDVARRVHGDLVAALAAAGVPLRLLLGSEIHLCDDLAGGLRAGHLLTLAGNPRWFLLELPSTHVPIGFDRLVFDLHIAGCWPVLAHPERNDELAADAGKMEKLRAQGLLVQITAQSVTGAFGKRALKASERWLRAGLVDFLATDAHDTVRRPPRLADALERVARLAGAAAAERLVGDNVERVLRGEEIA